MQSVTSFMKRMNNAQPIQLPWGTPLMTFIVQIYETLRSSVSFHDVDSRITSAGVFLDSR